MKSNELLPFSRNRYYKGKMLTSSDFAAEQTYVNHKRRFVNQMVMGSGVVCGLNVISLDDLSVMLESGMALDDGGREIVVNSTVVKRLSTIKGFDELTSDKACLCLRYKENETQPVYAVNRGEGEDEYEYNRIEEDYELFLADYDSLDTGFETETEFFTGGCLFEDEDYQVNLKLPVNLSAGHFVKLLVEVKKFTDAEGRLSYEGILQAPALTTLEGEHELKISLENIGLKAGGTVKKEYWVSVQSEEQMDSSVVLKPASARAAVGDKDAPVSAGLNCKINVVSDEPEVIAARETGKMSMEIRAMSSGKDYVCLAVITLVRTEMAYLIERVDESVKNYLPTMSDAALRNDFLHYFYKKYPFYGSSHMEESASEQRVVKSVSADGYKMETGIVEIPLGDNARRGDVCYSGEIMHGLGKGNVYVQIGLERLEYDQALGENGKTTTYGNADIFPSDGPAVSTETAVKLFNDKGSFMVGVRLLRDVDYLLLTYRWVAIRIGGEETLTSVTSEVAGRSISAVTPTVVLGTRETFLFQVKFNNMKASSLTYEVSEPGSGEITAEGLYTAPSKEGVYEVRIFCTDQPSICTYAYAIVKKKVTEEEG